MGRFATTVALYEELRPHYPPAFFRSVAQKLRLGKEHALIDLGTGPGLLALGFGPYVGRIGVRVNSIAPGEIDTSILSPGTEKIVEQQIPLHRLGTPDEVAKIIYVLCTETSSYVNGAEIHINGGQHV